MFDQPLPQEGGDAASYRYIRELRSRLRSMVDPFHLPDGEFVRNFRLSKQLVREVIEDITPFMYFGGHGGALSIETKVISSIRFIFGPSLIIME